MSMKRIFGCVALGLATIAASAQWTNPSEDVPAYNASAPVKPLPPVLSRDQLTGIYFTHSYQVTTYKMAAAIPAVLHQQPCYCHCDRVMRHNSLHSCFEGTHGATCSTCMKETVYASSRRSWGEHRHRFAQASSAETGRTLTWIKLPSNYSPHGLLNVSRYGLSFRSKIGSDWIMRKRLQTRHHAFPI